MAKAVSKSSAPKAPAKSSGNSSKSSGTSKTNASNQATSAKSADIKSTTPSERAKDILRNNEINDGVFKSRSDATVGDIAQAAVMKENNINPDDPDIKLDPQEVQAKMDSIIKNNESLKKAAEEAGINIDNPTEEDLQKLANLDVKAGQEVNVSDKKTEEEAGAEGTGEGEEAEGAGGAGGAGGAEEAGDKKDTAETIKQIVDLINKAESASQQGNSFSAEQLAGQAIQLINQVRSSSDCSDSKKSNNDKSTNLVNKINSSAKLDSSVASSISSLSGEDLNQVLSALEARANRIRNKMSDKTMGYLGLTAEQNKVLSMIGLKEPILKLLK